MKKPNKLIKISHWPQGHNYAFSIRDDDLSYFTRPEQLDQIYSEAWKNKFIVSFATIPNHKASDTLNVPPSYRNKHTFHSINNNISLIEYIIDKNKLVDILQHGYSHIDKENKLSPFLNYDKKQLVTLQDKSVPFMHDSEFFNLNYIKTEDKISKGKQILEDAFKKSITVLVTPQEYISRNIFKAAYLNNMSICGGINKKSLLKIPFTQLKYNNLIMVLYNYFISRANKNIIYDLSNIAKNTLLLTTYRHYWNKYTERADSNYNYNKAIQIIKEKESIGGYFIMLNHYWEYYYDWEKDITNSLLHEYFNKILYFVNKNTNAWKCSISELSSWISLRQNIKISIKKNEITIDSPNKIKGLCLEHPPGYELSISEKEVIKCRSNKSIFNIDKGTTHVQYHK